ncbi:hypothetical protein [Paenibacillus agricola]|uniref:hypothetical protein n=1 Tax=Paenibacillus agricola TaxID=2716264 RepID=UPI00140B66F7|nr:hypothetical protein [Paenibacillus agricola]
MVEYEDKARKFTVYHLLSEVPFAVFKKLFELIVQKCNRTTRRKFDRLERFKQEGQSFVIRLRDNSN